jgi:NAD(P)-dependent dehydrogenase (short-subunit alcohol dehydrogenase family)
MLEGQVALVTGAGRGLGRAFAERLAGLGCHIAVHGMREHGPSEYGGGQTLSDVARTIAEAHRVRTIKGLGDPTRSFALLAPLRVCRREKAVLRVHGALLAELQCVHFAPAVGQ